MNELYNEPWGITYKKGDLIGQMYEVCDVLGVGGFGVVYLVYSREIKSVLALKTYRDEYLEDAERRERFRKEAQVWIDLGRHPYLVRVYFVVEISGRLFIGMEYIARDELGRNSLEAYLRGNPPKLTQNLKWGIQFCHGIEYAYSKGIRAHRDIKPANIMIGQGKVLKISDFGLAGVIGTSKAISGIKLGIRKDRVGLSCQTIEGTGFGTPTHMPPEQFTNALACDQRSDIYSFGIVLFQMATGGKLPFPPTLPKNDSEEEARRFWLEMYRLHSEAPIPKLNSPLSPIIHRCLKKELGKRYQSFKELRLDLEHLLRQETGETFHPPVLTELTCWEWCNKGVSLRSIGRFDEAVICYDKALEIDPRFAGAWSNKGADLGRLGHFHDAILCINKALEIDPRSKSAWLDKGASFVHLGRFDQAIICFDKALEIDSLHPIAWRGKGTALNGLGRFDEAIVCFEKALEIDPRYVDAWIDKGVSLANIGQFDAEIKCYDKAIAIDPRSALAWSNKGLALLKLNQFCECIVCFDKAIEIDRNHAFDYYLRALAQEGIGRREDAVRSYQQFIGLAPSQSQYGVQIEEARQRLQDLEAK